MDRGKIEFVVSHGERQPEWPLIVASRGDIDHRYKIYSARKSLLHALTGIAVNAHQLDVDDTLGTLGIDDVLPNNLPAVKSLVVWRSGKSYIAQCATFHRWSSEGERVHGRWLERPVRFWSV